jgi:protein ImuA
MNKKTGRASAGGWISCPFKGLAMLPSFDMQELRNTIARMERPPGLEDAGVQPFGIAALDAVLGGGLARGALHEISAVSEAHVATASGFALGICAGRTPSPRLRGEGRGEGQLRQEKRTPHPTSLRSADLSPQAGRGKAIVWIAEDMARIETGAPFGCGLEEFGVRPERLLTVSVKERRDLLWAMEETMRCSAVDTVIGELRAEGIDAVALRRLSLAACERGMMALLLRSKPSLHASTAATRWIVGAAPSQPRYGPGPPRFNAQLVRNRRGPLGSWMLEWNEKDECFSLASTHSQPVAPPPADRPAGQVAVA